MCRSLKVNPMATTTATNNKKYFAATAVKILVKQIAVVGKCGNTC